MPVEVPLQLPDELARERHCPLPSPGLRRPEAQRVQLNDRRRDLDRRRLEVHIPAGQRHQLAPTKAREAGHQHQRPVPRPDLLRDEEHLNHRGDRPLDTLVLIGPLDPTRVAPDQLVVGRRVQHSPQQASIYRFDREMLVNHHVFGLPAAHAPVMHLRQLDSGDLFTTCTELFERVWAGADPAWQREAVAWPTSSWSTTRG
jgi:hypothetical protein